MKDVRQGFAALRQSFALMRKTFQPMWPSFKAASKSFKAPWPSFKAARTLVGLGGATSLLRAVASRLRAVGLARAAAASAQVAVGPRRSGVPDGLRRPFFRRVASLARRVRSLPACVPSLAGQVGATPTAAARSLRRPPAPGTSPLQQATVFASGATMFASGAPTCAPGRAIRTSGSQAWQSSLPSGSFSWRQPERSAAGR
jgi:hypothetical protein